MKGGSAFMRAVLAAPLVVVPIVVLAMLVGSEGEMERSMSLAVNVAFGVALPFAYVGMLCVGLPVYFVLRRFNVLSAWLLCLLGFAVPFGLFGVSPPASMAFLVGACGAAVALAAWLMLPRVSKSPQAGVARHAP